MSHAALLRGDALGAGLPPLLVRAEQAAATVLQGQHGRRRAGPGENFWQFRRYQPGDALTMVDWRQTAKGDHTYVREREWAAAETVALWCAAGPAMDWRSDAALPSKREHAKLLTLATACLLVKGGERLRLLGDHFPTGSGRGVLHRLAAALDQPQTAALDLPPPPHGGRSTLLLVSDWWQPVPAIAERIGQWAATGARGHVVDVVDPAEEMLPYQGRVRFTATATTTATGDGVGHWLAERVEDMRSSYIERVAEQRAAVLALVRAAGWSLSRHRTDQPLAPALLAITQALSGEGQR